MSVSFRLCDAISQIEYDRGLRYITKVCHRFKVNLMTLLLVGFCFIYYTASFRVTQFQNQTHAFPLCSTKLQREL